MEKKVHIWKVKCKNCGETFDHIFVASDILKPHIFNELSMKCPKCGMVKFDPVSPSGKMTLQEWQTEHPDMNLSDLPDHSYVDENP